MISSNLSRAIGIIYKRQDLLNLKWSIVLYNTFFLLHIMYCAGIWAACGKTKIHPINVLKPKAFKIILQLPYLTPSADLYAQLCVLQPRDICEQQHLIFIFKLVNGLITNPAEDLLNQPHHTHSLSTRNESSLYI